MPCRLRRAASILATALIAAIPTAAKPAVMQLLSAPSIGTPLQPVAAKSPRKDAKKSAAKKAKRKEAARETRVWKFGREGGNPTLQFGQPSGRQVTVSFSCEPASDLVRIDSFIGSRGLRPGDGARLRLSNGSARFEVAGTGVVAETKDTVDVVGTTRIDSKLFALFRAGETMILEVPGRKAGLSLKAIGSAAAAFEKACQPTG
jgi:hypothetical protein